MEDKICVFDLDGTLWKENSHVDIVQKYNNTCEVGKKIEKVFALFFPNLYLKYLLERYNKVPFDFIQDYEPPFRKSAIEIFEDKAADGYQIICISNAPLEIIKKAGERLGIKAYKAPIGKKDIILKEKYITWNKLVVVTDNVSDESILKLSDEAYIYTTKNRKRYFTRMKLTSYIRYIDYNKE